MAKEVRYKWLNTKEQKYLQIYHEYYVLHWTEMEIAQYHKCSVATVRNALNWVDNNKLHLPAEQLLRGAVDTVKIRLRLLREMYDTEAKKQRKVNKSFLLSINQEMRADEKLLFQLEDVLNERQQHDVTMKLNSADVLKLITAADTEKAEESAENRFKNKQRAKDEE